MSVLVLLEVGWDETNRPITVRGELIDADGAPVAVDGPQGRQPVRLEAQTEVGRPPGIPPGTPMQVPIAFDIGPGLPLPAGQRYEWRVSVNGQTHPVWSAGFMVRA